MFLFGKVHLALGHRAALQPLNFCIISSISGLVVEYIVAIDVTRVRFPAHACFTPCLVKGHWGIIKFIPQGMHLSMFLGLLPSSIFPENQMLQTPAALRHSCRLCAPGVTMGNPTQATLVCTSGWQSRQEGETQVESMIADWTIGTQPTPSHQHQWSSGRIHRCHRCDPGSIPG